APENPNYTQCVTSARIVCPLWGWSKPVEGVGIEKFKANVHKARDALEHVLHAIKSPKRLLMETTAANAPKNAAIPADD
ncbi:hypothetical protein SARC_09534, partial [Sphaeroforma arctica JP610]